MYCVKISSGLIPPYEHATILLQMPTALLLAFQEGREDLSGELECSVHILR